MTKPDTPPAAADPTAGTRRSLRRHIAGVGAIIAVALGAGAWTGATELSGAIIASGSSSWRATSRRFSIRPAAWSLICWWRRGRGCRRATF